MDPITLAVLLTAVGWVATAPDPVTAAARSGTSTAARSGTRAAVGSLRSDWHQARANRSRTAADRQQQRRRRWADSNTTRAKVALVADDLLGRGGWVEQGGQSVGRALRAGITAARTGWHEGRRNPRRGLPLPRRTDKAPAPVTAPVTTNDEPTPQTPAPDSPGGEHQEETMGATNRQPLGLGRGDLTSPAALAGELKTLDGELEEIQLRLAEIAGYLQGIGDRYAGSSFGSSGLTSGVGAMTEHGQVWQQVSTQADQLREVIAGTLRSAQEAQDLGEQAAAIGAVGDVKAFGQE